MSAPKKNIILIGFMGTGKTCIGLNLRKLSGYDYLDTDTLIENLEGMSVKNIFAAKGEKHFRELETRICSELPNHEKTIISTGGGTVLTDKNRLWLKKTGIIFLLTASPQTILKRISKNKKRPILNVPDPLKKIQDLLAKRKLYYKKTADISIDTNTKSPQEIALKIWEIFKGIVKTRFIASLLFLFLILSLLTPINLQAAPKKEYEAGVLIVKLKKSSGFTTFATSKILTFSKNKGAQFIKPLVFPQKNLRTASTQSSFYLVRFKQEKDIEAKSKEYISQDWVEYAEPNYYLYASSFPNDPLYIDQTYLNQTKLKDIIKLPEQANILVAVIDSGVDSFHPDLVDNIFHNSNEILNGIDDDKNGYIDDVAGYNFQNFTNNTSNHQPIDNFGHGTHIAGIIAAKTNNNIGIAGINSGTKILNIRFLDASGRGTQTDAAAAIRYAVDMGAKIINCSWGFYKYNQILKEAIEYAVANGVIVTAAVGNLGHNLAEYPAAFDNVLGISSVDFNGNKSSFSSFGNHVDFAAYGHSIFSSLPQNNYGNKSGTSQATAIISGIISKILSEKPNLPPSEVNSLLINSSQDLKDPGKDIYTGYGIIDIPKLFTNMNVSLPIPQPQPTPSPKPQEEKNFFQILLELPIMIISGIIDFFV